MDKDEKEQKNEHSLVSYDYNILFFFEKKF